MLKLVINTKRKSISNRRNELRCSKCGRLLEKIKTLKAEIEIKCPKCKTLNKIIYDNATVS